MINDQEPTPEKGVDVFNTEIIHYCDYGCGQEAHHQLKNGKWCCSISYNKCPSLRKKNSENITKAHKNGKISTPDTISKLKHHHPWNYGLKKPKIYHPGKCEQCGKDHDGTYGSGRFCSQSCSTRWVNLHKTPEQKKKQGSVKLEKEYLIRKENYLKNPQHCSVCNIILPYEKRLNKTCSRECHKLYMSSDTLLNKIKEGYLKNGTSPGGYRKGSGKGKKGFYKGYWCDSSWELAFTIYNLEHDIKFQRFDYWFEYEYMGKKFKYYPDYLMGDGTIIEIKGRVEDPQWQAKLKSVPSSFNVKVITWKEIQMYLKYVENKYGKDFIRLYENKSSKMAQ